MLTAAFIASFVIGVAAQEPPPPNQGQSPAAQAEKITVSGCIQNAPPAAPAPGATAAASAESKFELADAKAVPETPVGTAGTAASTERYRLEGEEETLAPHLNHQVEITGTVSPPSATAEAAAPTLKVESVKMVAAMCP
jgi:hypothetical protein